MLEARAWILIEPILPNDFAKKVRYITDLIPEVVICDIKDLTKALRIEFQMPRKHTNSMEDHLGSGMSLIVDLDKKDFNRWDEQDSALISKGIIRSNQKKVNHFDLAIKSKSIEKIVNKQLRRM